MTAILVGCHRKSLIAVGSRENGGKEMGNCMYRQILQKNITVNGEKRHGMIAGGKSKTKRIFLLFLRWKKEYFFMLMEIIQKREDYVYKGLSRLISGREKF